MVYNVVDFKTGKQYRPKAKDVKEVKKVRTIQFLEKCIENLMDDEIDPEECIVITRWEINDRSKAYELVQNSLSTDACLSMLEQSKNFMLNPYD